MSILGKLFNKKQESRAPQTEAPPPSSDPANDPNLIRVFDKYGQELFISKDQWRTSVLPGTLKSQWDSPELLYGTIVSALNDGFVTEVLEAAEHLNRIDPDAMRGACIYGIVLMKNSRLDEAERVLKSFLEKHGEEGVVLTNLAKVYADRGDMKTAEATLWHALEIDPNQDNGLGWFEALNRERSGEDAGLDALRRIAALPGSWRAQLWLARAALRSRDLPQALAYYRESLSRAGKNIPTDMLMQISGDLGNSGHLSELLEIAEPHFVPEQHGLEVGNNLIKAHLELGHLDDARRILDQLYALQRPDWQPTLNYWDSEIARARLETSKVPLAEPLSMEMLTIEGAVWLKPDSPATRLFPPDPANGPVITFLGSSVTVAAPSNEIEQQLADAPGGMSRALPLFLAEQVKFACDTNVQTFIPWIPAGTGGFVLSGVAWSDEDALGYVRQSDRQSDYLVVVHLNTESDLWRAYLRLLRVADGQTIGRLETSFRIGTPADGVIELVRGLIELMLKEVASRSGTTVYQTVDAADLGNYLLRLEQLLAVRCAGMEGVSTAFLHGEREIVSGNLQLSLRCPENLAVRVLLAQTMLSMNKVKPNVVKEFADRVMMLHDENPLSEPAQSVVQKMLSELAL